MATKTYYELDTLASSSNFHALQDGGSAPTQAAFSPAAGWTQGTTAASNYSDLDSQAKSSSFSPTVGPGVPNNTPGNCFRTPTALTGTFAAGNWTLGLFGGPTASWSFGSLRFRWRVFKSSSLTGASPTELTGSTQLTPATGSMNTFSPAASSVTWNAPAITLSAEHLFFALSCEIVTANSSGFGDYVLYESSSASIVTTDFTAGVSGPTQDVGMVPIA